MELEVRDVPEMYTEVLWALKINGHKQDSRNGEVLALPAPLTVTVRQPWNRVLFDENRNANPFFHVMEAVWMMAGRNDLEWIQQFNKRFSEYAEKDGTLHGAYGHRWRRHFNTDQVVQAARQLSEDPSSRRVVLGMWDPEVDLGIKRNDLPCNTHVYLRCVNGALDMTVCNRSNDIVWGMTGANAVHMTILHEVLAHGAGCRLGVYRVFTNNAHLYEHHWHLTEFPREAERVPMWPEPIIRDDENLETFLADCEYFCKGKYGELRNKWLRETALPMKEVYEGTQEVYAIKCPQWRIACVQWLHWNRQ